MDLVIAVRLISVAKIGKKTIASKYFSNYFAADIFSWSLNRHSKRAPSEGGAHTLKSFLVQDLWDEIRVETNMGITVKGGTRAPQLPANAQVLSQQVYGENVIVNYVK